MAQTIDPQLDSPEGGIIRRRRFLQIATLGLTTAAMPSFVSAPGVADAVSETVSSGNVIRGGALRIGVPEPFTGFDPYGKRSRTDYQATDNILDRLVTYDTHYVPRPMLAESWHNPDGATWVFKLRTGVTFH